MRKFLIAIMFFLLIPSLSQANQLIISNIRVVDGDTLYAITKDGKKQKLRLHGIDAPELKQFCLDQNNRKYACGQQAKTYLQTLISRQMRCDILDKDRYNRLIARCFHHSGADICAEMVQAGHAIAYLRYSHDYIEQENSAHVAGRGLWQGAFQPPADWRRSRK